MLENQVAERIADWRPTSLWIAECGGHVFKTKSSFEWFVRQHYEQLILSGQFITRRGPCGALVGPDFDRVVLGILRGRSSAEMQDV
jgi:hypothetical protein